MASYYFTTPIYYVNGEPHIGHAYTTIAADTFARWQRLRGNEARLVTGTDEHGQKVLQAAVKAGRTPEAHVDLLHVRFKDTFDRLDVAYDDFIRTTEPRHKAVVTSLLARLYERGEIYPAEYAGWYSTSAERFWSEEEVAAASGGTVEDLRAGRIQGVCPDGGGAVEWLKETNWFFRMSAYQERLLAHIEAHPDCIQPAMRRNEVLGYLRRPLGDLCISRPKARMSWGVPLPFDDSQVTYVWVDALTNYVSSIGYGTSPDFDKWWSNVTHLMGKDILTFHTVYWFSLLMAYGIPLPKRVFAHGWWLIEGTKMSKSLGNVVDVQLFIDAFGLDAVRYFLLREIPFGGDGELAPEAFLVRYNADLANDLGNLAHRALSMTERWLGATVPPRSDVRPQDAALVAIAERATGTFAEEMERLAPRQALEALWELVRAGNKYVDTEAPWALHKQGQLDRLGTVLRHALEVCRVVASHLVCVCPRKGAELLERLGLPAPDLRATLDALPDHAPTATRDPLFPRMLELPGVFVPQAPAPAPKAARAAPRPASPPTPTAEKAPVSTEPVPAAPPATPEITYDDFARLQLRTGNVLAAERHPNADKLLVLKVDVGEPEPRTIVAGIAAVYAPEDLVGKTVVVVANLKPAKLRGVMSQGMLLAAGGPEIAALVTPIKPVAAGSVVK